MKHIIGHRNPDTDTICSAIAYQFFLQARGVESKAFALGDVNNETKFVLERFGVEAPGVVQKLPRNSEIVLVDHNEESQSIGNVNDLEIVEIIDHHKIKLETDRPIAIQIEPLGSSCSIIAKKYFEAKIEVSKEIASLMIAGIVSDTLYFRSPTTTEIDKELVKKLNEIAKIEDLEVFSLEMFDAKSDVGEFSAEELIRLDYKNFDFSGKKYGIATMETTNKEAGLERKDEILEKMIEIKEKENLTGLYFIIVDILREESYTFCSGKEEEDLFVKLFDAKETDGVFFVDKLVSRKKQVVPVFEKYFK